MVSGANGVPGRASRVDSPKGAAPLVERAQHFKRRGAPAQGRPFRLSRAADQKWIVTEPR
jgi:hypothetical protein